MPGGAVVEVRKSAESSTWYNATVVDVGKDTISVEFEGEVWPPREVPTGQVRMCPPTPAAAASGAAATEEDDFDPQVDDVVEVNVAATEASPSGWSRGTVKKIKNRVFYFVACEGHMRTTQDVIVEKDSLRRVNASLAIDPAALFRKIIPVERGLHAWIRSQDSAGCLDDVAARTNLLAASITTGRLDAKGTPKVLLIGDEEGVLLGEKLLIEIHFRNQIWMQGFHDYRERFLEKIKEYETQWGTWHKEVFTVDTSFVGRIIGSKGANIAKLRQEFGVDITLEEDESTWETHITVAGEDENAIKQARDKMEYVTTRIQVDPDQVGWIVGKGYQNLQEIQAKAELTYARFDDKTSSIELCGLRAQVEDAKLMVAVHRDYLSVYQDMSDERKSMLKQFEELDKKGGGKGKKGKDRSGRGGADEDDWGGGKKGGKDRGGKGGADEDDWGGARGSDSGKGKGKGEKGENGKDWKGQGEKGKGEKGKGDKGKGKNKGKGNSDWWEEVEDVGWDDWRDDRSKGGGGKGSRGGGGKGAKGRSGSGGK